VVWVVCTTLGLSSRLWDRYLSEQQLSTVVENIDGLASSKGVDWLDEALLSLQASFLYCERLVGVVETSAINLSGESRRMQDSREGLGERDWARRFPLALVLVGEQE
jgi:hypothetical protein